MVMYTVYNQYLCTKFNSTLCSKSTLFLIFTTFWAFFLPLLIAYRSQGFWVKDLSYREQPVVRFKHKYFILLETDQENDPIICTSLTRLEMVLENYDRCTLVKANEMDLNDDAKQDELNLDVEVSLYDDVNVKSIYLLLAFDYILQHQCLLQMESLAIIQSDTTLASSEYKVIGDLQLVQKTLLSCRGRDLRFNESLLTDDLEIDLNIDDAIEAYMRRNVYTKLENKYSIWTRRSGVPSFHIKAQINYSETTVHYRPGFWPVMKWAWIQYLAILTIFLALLRWVKSYVFVNHLLPTVSNNPWLKLVMK